MCHNSQMKFTRRTQLLFPIGVAIASFGLTSNATASPFTLPVAQTLDDDLKHAVSHNQPLVVMVGFEGCPFCKVVRQNYLPSVQQEQKLTIVEIDMRKNIPVRDFSGQLTTHEQLAKDWHIKVAPTLLFYGKDGREVARRLVGLSPDFYSAYLQDRIDRAIASFKQL